MTDSLTQLSQQDFQELFSDVYWHQKWEIAPGVFTPGNNPVAELCDYARLPDDLSGKRVLDIGAWNGCFSFECERRGAKEVVAYSLENPDVAGFNKLKAALNSQVKYVQGSVYALDPEVLGKFEIILFFGVLYHLRYPLLAIDRIRTVCNGTVYTETHIASNRLLLRKPFYPIGRILNLSSWFQSTPIWRQYKEYELHPEDRSNWFGPNIPAAIESFDSAGFTTVHLKTWNGDRAAFKSEIDRELPDRIISGSYEGVSPANANLTGLPLHQDQLYQKDKQ